MVFKEFFLFINGYASLFLKVYINPIYITFLVDFLVHLQLFKR